MKTLKINPYIAVIVEKTTPGFSAFILNYDGVVGTGKTLQKLKENIKDAFNLYLEGIYEDGEIFDYGYEDDLAYYNKERVPNFKYFIEE